VLCSGGRFFTLLQVVLEHGSAIGKLILFAEEVVALEGAEVGK
jgi:hypothetical protein